MGRRRIHAAFILYKTLGYPELGYILILLPLQGAWIRSEIYPGRMPWAMYFCPFGARGYLQIESCLLNNFNFDTPATSSLYATYQEHSQYVNVIFLFSSPFVFVYVYLSIYAFLLSMLSSSSMPLKEGHNYMLYAIKTQFSLIQNTSPNLYLAKYKLYLAKYNPYLAKYKLGEVLCS